MQPGHQRQRPCGWGELARAESQQRLVPELAGVWLCSKSWQPLEHSWKGQSHRTGMKVAPPDGPPQTLPRDSTIM